MVVADAFRFRFELDAVRNINPWGEPPKAVLNWFGLTSGRYWIETPCGEVLRYTAEIRKLWSSPFPYAEYEVARLFEDLQEHLPATLEPVPEDVSVLATDSRWLERLASCVDEECSEAEGLGRWDLYERAMSWWWHRQLDTGYLKHGPSISMWRTGENVHFRWTTLTNVDRGVPVFTDPSGEFRMSCSTFFSAAIGFCTDVLSAMRTRVADLRNSEWSRTDYTLDLDALSAEQQRREEMFRCVTNQKQETDWVEVRTQLRDLQSRIGHV